MRIGILGFGIEGRSVLAAFQRWGETSLTVLTDSAPTELGANPDVPWLHGPAAEKAIASLDLVVKSPGIPPRHPLVLAIQRAGVAQTTATDLYLERVRASGAPVIGITGSKGKSTTATLIYQLLLAAGRKAVLVGNIGAPCLDVLEEVIAKGSITVFELSSYQCHDLSLGPTDALVLGLFPEHMDWHGSVTAYYQAKLRIASTQRSGDRTFYNAGDAELCRCLPLGPGDHFGYNHPQGLHYQAGWFWDGSQRLISAEAMQLPGYHNRINALGAFAVARTYGIGEQHFAEVLAAFKGLPHRLESLGIHQGIHWVDDSIATAPQATCAALEAINNVQTLILGGADRGYDFSPLAPAITRSGVRHVILLPPGGGAIKKALNDIHRGGTIRLHEANTLQEAVTIAKRMTTKGQTCLLSPGSPSYGVYRNFVERGEHYRRLVIGPK